MYGSHSARVSRYPFRSACHVLPDDQCRVHMGSPHRLEYVCAFIIQTWKWMCLPLRGAISVCRSVSLRRSYDYVHFIFCNGTRLRIRGGKKKISYLSVAASVKMCALKFCGQKRFNASFRRVHGVASGHRKIDSIFVDFNQFRCAFYFSLSPSLQWTFQCATAGTIVRR